MKIRIFILSLSVLLLASTALIPSIVYACVPSVLTVRLKTADYRKYVNANGSFENKSQSDVYVKIPAVIKATYAEVGDYVNEGDILAEIDPDKTKRLYDNLLSSNICKNGSNSLVNYISENYGTIDEMQITADKSGIISGINISDGNIATPVAPVFSVSASDDFCVKVSVDESKIESVKVGQRAQITMVADNSKIYSGTVSKISPVARKTVSLGGIGTVVDVYIDLDNADKYIKSGYSARVKIEVASKNNLPILPYTAIHQDEDENEYVFTVCNGVIAKKYIETGLELTDGVEIINGLTGNDLVTDSQAVYTEGQLVK